MAAALSILIPATGSFAASGSTEIVSLSDSEQLGNQASGDAAVSKGGRFVAFTSQATNFAPDDTNMTNDVFVRDRDAGTVELISVGTNGGVGNGQSYGTAISDDGRYVAFVSIASNLVPNDTNGTSDVFVRDRLTGETELVSVNPSGESGDAASVFGLDMSSDGRFVVFASLANDLTDDPATDYTNIYVRDRVLGVTERITMAPDGSPANRRSQGEPSISSDGRFVAFESSATNLAPRDTNHSRDVFVIDRESDKIILASRGRDGESAHGVSRLPDISDDGNHLAFASEADNLVKGDTNGVTDTFWHSLVSGVMRRISLMPDGSEAQPQVSTNMTVAISAHGHFVAFNYLSTLVDPTGHDRGLVYLWNHRTRALEVVSVNNQGEPATKGVALCDISPHGRYVTFAGNAQNLTPHRTDGPQAFMRIRS